MSKIISVNSLSGGRTSSYLAVNYPSDIDIFSMVVSDCHNSNTKFKRDKKLIQKVNDKIQAHSINKDEVIGTPEDVNTIKIIFELEQFTGREIKWVRGVSWEQLIKDKSAIPNQAMRFCSFNLKILPIFEYLKTNDHHLVDMRIGYRYDEQERKQTFTTDIKYVDSVNLFGNGRNNWKTVTWRKGSFPLIDDKIIHPQIIAFWQNHSSFQFPLDSNCQMCFWKQQQQLRKNFDTNPSIMMWAAVQEEIQGNTFKKDASLLEINKSGLQLDFIFGTGTGCGSGMCIG